MTTRRYAADTSVSVERSRIEIEALLTRYGADQFLSGWDAAQAVIAFRMQGRHVKFVLPLPLLAEFQRASTRTRTPASTQRAWEQACRSRWRALGLAIKAKLETIETGISTFDNEFLAFIRLPNGETFGDWAAPQIEQAYTLGEMPSLLQLGSGS